MSIFSVPLSETISGKDSDNSVKLLTWCYDFDTGKPVYLFIRSGRGFWSFTGGHIHKDECPYKGGCREAKEEVGLNLNPKDCRHLFTVERMKGDGKVAFVEVQYQTPRSPPRVVQVQPDKGFPRPEVMEIRWVSSVKDLNLLDIDKRLVYWMKELVESRLKGQKQSRFEIEWENQKGGKHDGNIL